MFFQPKLLKTFAGYNQTLFIKDLLAGLTVGIVALPLAMAFAIASGLKPEAGIFTGIIDRNCRNFSADNRYIASGSCSTTTLSQLL